MFSLLVTVISIALVAALALATLYHGGRTFSHSASKAEAVKIALQGQQLLGAAELYYANNGNWPDSLSELTTGEYLKQVPSAQVSGLAEATAAAQLWDMPIKGQPMFLLKEVSSEEVCAEINRVSSLRQYAILRHAYSGLTSQCYGGGPSSLIAVFKKTNETLLRNSVEGTGLASDDILPGAPPSDPQSAEWLKPPHVDGSAGIPPAAPPDLYVTQPNLYFSFSTPELGQTQTSSFWVHNVGSIPASGLTITVSGSGYGVSNDCTGTLGVSGSCQVTVSFTPTAEQAYPGTLTVKASGAQPIPVPLLSEMFSPLITELYIEYVEGIGLSWSITPALGRDLQELLFAYTPEAYVILSTPMLDSAIDPGSFTSVFAKFGIEPQNIGAGLFDTMHDYGGGTGLFPLNRWEPPLYGRKLGFCIGDSCADLKPISNTNSATWCIAWKKAGGYGGYQLIGAADAVGPCP